MISATSNYIAALSAFTQGQLPMVISISGYSKAFTNFKSGVAGQVDWLIAADDYSTTVNDLEGGADQSQFVFSVQDNSGGVTADFPSFTFEGKQITVKTGLPGLAQADFMTVFTGFIDTVESTNANQDYVFTCSDVSSTLSQVVYTTGDSGKPTDSNNPKTILGHPLDILLDILGVKIGLSGSLYDSTKIQAYRDGPFSGLQFKFVLDQPVAAMDFIKQQLLKPLGGYLWVNSAGVITVNFFYPLSAPVAVASLGTSFWLDVPDAEQVDMVNTVQFQFDKDDTGADASGNYMAIDTEQYGASVAKYGQYGEQVIQADGMRSGFQGFFNAKIVSRMIFGRYGFKNLKFDQNAPEAIWQACRLEPGDIVSVTHPQVPDRSLGTIGISGKLFEVLDRKLNFTEGRVTLTMIDASYLNNFGVFQISGDAQADYTPGSNTFMYLCNDLDKQGNGDAAHVLG